MVDRARHICEQVRVPIGIARDERPELYPLRDLRHRPEERPALEVLAVGIAVEREEVVPGEKRVSPHLFDPEPSVAHLRITRVLRLKLYPDPYRHTSPPLLVNREIMPRDRGALSSPVEVESAPLAEPATRIPHRVPAPGSLMSLTRSRAEKMTITPTPRRT